MSEKSPEDLFKEIYDDLYKLARWLMERERLGHTLQPTALLGEVWIKLFAKKLSFEGTERAELIKRAVSAMRRILIDHARRRNAEKRGGEYRRVPLLDDIFDRRDSQKIDALELDDALTKLAEDHPRPAQAMNLRLIAGLPIPEIAALLEFSQETIRTDLSFARARLFRVLREDTPSGS